MDIFFGNQLFVGSVTNLEASVDACFIFHYFQMNLTLYLSLLVVVVGINCAPSGSMKESPINSKVNYYKVSARFDTVTCGGILSQ